LRLGVEGVEVEGAFARFRPDELTAAPDNVFPLAGGLGDPTFTPASHEGCDRLLG
jgi:hypothetical protein